MVTRSTGTAFETATSPVELVHPQFEPYSPKNSAAILKKLHDLIKRPFIRSEWAPGYLYAFKRDDGNHIKVGWTRGDRVQDRIDEWNRHYNYKVKKLLERHVSHAKKLESLVHASLHHVRRKEILINGRCDGGKGRCSSVHQEWFEVSLGRLKDVVDAWVRWFKTEPYDEGGNLKPIWIKHMAKMRSRYEISLHDPWRDWIDISILAESTTVIEVKEEEAIESEVEVNTETVITDIEIKDEPRDTPAADIPTLGRIYVDNINRLRHRALTATATADAEIKEEPREVPAADIQEEVRRRRLRFLERISPPKDQTPKTTPLVEVIQDVSLHLDDPFLVSPVAG
jgi:hypothetical protein